jgi:membrane protease YdiL (CAAX protease family)
MDFFSVASLILERLSLLFPGILCVLPAAIITTLSLRKAIRSDGSIVVEPDPDPVIDRFIVDDIFAPLIWAPIVEELLFRAPLIVLFPETTPLAWAVALGSGVLFARAHGGLKHGFMSVFVLARLPSCWIMPVVAIWTHSILACVAAHFAWNLFWTVIQLLFHNIVRRHPEQYPRLNAFYLRMQERMKREMSSS